MFFGSPYPDGRTGRMVKAFLEPFRQDGDTIKIVDSYQEHFLPCTACGVCKTEETCAQHDMDKVDRLYREADLVVVASPVYNLSFPAPMKAILDRFQRYYEARFSLGKKPSISKHKAAVLLAVLATEDMSGVTIMEKQLRLAFSVMNTTLESVISWSGTDQEGGTPQREKDAISRAKEAALAIKEKV